jgi:hypothetical protein
MGRLLLLMGQGRPAATRLLLTSGPGTLTGSFWAVACRHDGQL